MASGWFVFAVVACIVMCTGCVLAFVMLKASWAQRQREALTTSDLRALEESALYLIDQLKSEVEQSMADLDARREALSQMIESSDRQIAVMKELLASVRAETPSPVGVVVADNDLLNDPRRQQILDLADSGMDCAEIAREAGVDCAEVKLMLRLAGR